MVIFQIRWSNTHIRLNSVPIKWDNYMRKGVLYIKDILLDADHFMTYDEFCETFDIQTPWLCYHSLIQAISKDWFTILNITQSEMCDKYRTDYDRLKNTKQSKSVVVYSRLMSQTCDVKNTWIKWSTKLHMEIEYSIYKTERFPLQTYDA